MQAEFISTEQRQNVEAPRAWRWLERRSDTPILLALALVVFATFVNSLGNRFAYDDHVLIETNYALRDWSYFTKAFADSHAYDVSWLNFSSSTLDQYRPFTRMLFALAFHAFGLQPGYWHLLNLAIFIVVVSLAYAVIKQLSGSRGVAAIGALLFAVHPIHSEAVAWVNSLVETLHALFFLGGFALYMYAEAEGKTRRGRIFFLGSLALVAAALLSKETALCFPILVAAYKFLHSEKKGAKSNYLSPFAFRLSALFSAARATMPYLFVVAAYFVLRYFAYGGALRVVGGLPLKTVILTIPGVVLEYLRMLVLPVGLSAVHSVPLVMSLASLRFWLPLLLLVLGATLIWLFTPRRAAFACAWMLITLLPALNIGAFASDLNVQDRYAFLPSLGFCAAVAVGFSALLESGGRLRRLRPVALTLFVAAVIGLSGLTARQNSFWYSDRAIFARAAEQNPNSELAHCSYGASLYGEGEKEEAARHFTLSFKLKNGESSCACLGLANYYADRGNYDQAIPFYERAVELGEGDINLLVFTQLAYAYNQKGQSDRAIKLLGETLTKHPKFQEARYTLGGILLNAGRIDEGINQLRVALELNPQDAGAHLLLGQAYERSGLRKEAAEQYRLALDITPNLEMARVRLSALEK